MLVHKCHKWGANNYITRGHVSLSGFPPCSQVPPLTQVSYICIMCFLLIFNIHKCIFYSAIHLQSHNASGWVCRPIRGRVHDALTNQTQSKSGGIHNNAYNGLLATLTFMLMFNNYKRMRSIHQSPKIWACSVVHNPVNKFWEPSAGLPLLTRSWIKNFIIPTFPCIVFAPLCYIMNWKYIVILWKCFTPTAKLCQVMTAESKLIITAMQSLQRSHLFCI